MPIDARQAVIDEARTWIDTPFHHQAALKGVGCDCGGLVRGVGEASGVMSMDRTIWRRFANYGRVPNPRRMERTLAAFMTCVWRRESGGSMPMLPADVLWLEWRHDLPMHLAIVANQGQRVTIIHALSDIGRVVEHGLTDEWRSRVFAVWRYPGLEFPDGT